METIVHPGNRAVTNAVSAGRKHFAPRVVIVTPDRLR